MGAKIGDFGWVVVIYIRFYYNYIIFVIPCNGMVIYRIYGRMLREKYILRIVNYIIMMILR